jgi:hypothetical protein
VGPLSLGAGLLTPAQRASLGLGPSGRNFGRGGGGGVKEGGRKWSYCICICCALHLLSAFIACVMLVY